MCLNIVLHCKYKSNKLLTSKFDCYFLLFKYFLSEIMMKNDQTYGYIMVQND